MTIDDLNKTLKDSLGIEPLSEFTVPKGEMEHSMRRGLAEMYANKGFRSYLERAINVAIHNAALSSGSDEVRGVFKGRALSFKELLAKAKKAFEEYEKIKGQAKKVESA